MSKIIIGDTSFWISLFYDSDQYHTSSIELYQTNIEICKFLFPWPTMYETLRTKFVRNYDAVIRLEKELRRMNIVKYGDRKLRDNALLQVFEYKKRFGQSLSLTDATLREIIKSGKTNINSIITSNKGDFIDVCQMYNVELIELI